MKEPVLNITLLLTVSLAAFWTTWLNQHNLHLERNTLEHEANMSGTPA